MNNSGLAIKLQVNTTSVKNKFEDIVNGIEGSYLVAPGDPKACDLLIAEVNGNPERDFQSLSLALANGMAKGIFVTSQRMNQEILMAALRAGVREFIPQPVDQAAVHEAIIKFSEQYGRVDKSEPVLDRGKIVQVIGSKGGVGTTAVAVNLATALMKLGGNRSVLLIDMQYPMGDVPLFLNIDNPAFDWAKISKNVSRVDATFLKSVLLVHPSGIHVLPSPVRTVEDLDSVVKVLDVILQKMQCLYDYIIIDGGSSINEVMTSVLRMADRIYIVAVLNLACLIKIRRLHDVLVKSGRSLQEDQVQIVFNRYQKNSLIALKDAEESLKKKTTLQIPNNYRMMTSAMNEGKSIVELSNGGDLGRSFMALASEVSGIAVNGKAGFFQRTFLKTK